MGVWLAGMVQRSEQEAEKKGVGEGGCKKCVSPDSTCFLSPGMIMNMDTATVLWT